MKWSHRSFFILSLAALFVASAGMAQGIRGELATHPPAQRAAALTGAMKEKLGLSEDQATKVLVINEQAANDVDLAVGALKRQDLRKQIKAINETRDNAFRDVLTPQQFSTWQETRREIIKALKERQKSRNTGPANAG
jgi:hypothetical protein